MKAQSTAMIAQSARCGAVQADMRERALVVGRFQPSLRPLGDEVCEAVDGDLRGCDVTTASLCTGAFAAFHLDFSGKTRARNGLAALMDGRRFDVATVCLDAFGFDDVDERHWYQRRMHECRKLGGLWAILRGARASAVVLRRDGWARWSHICALLVVFFAMLTGARVAIRRRSSEKLAVRRAVAEQILCKLAFGRGGTACRRRMDPETLLGSAQAALEDGSISRAVFDDLCEIAHTVRVLELRRHPVLRMLRHRPANLRMVPEDAPDEPTDAHGVPVTNYMMHLRELFGYQRRFALRNRADARQFLNWYLFEAPGELAARWVPISKAQRAYADGLRKPVVTLRTGDAQIDRMARALAQALDGAHVDADTWAYLRAPVGGDPKCVSRLAMLIALSARFDVVGYKAICAPWRDRDITLWMRNWVPRVLPHLQSRSTQSPRTFAPRMILSGLTDSPTGIAANLAMSRRAFEQIGITHDIHDVTGARAARHLPNGTHVPLRNLVLHHLNAERVPQMIHALGSGARNAHHIGFLLWEFDVIPQAHRHALDLLDEIWAPSAFVAQTYRQATSKPVICMGKGINVGRPRQLRAQRRELHRKTFTFLLCFDFHSSLARKNPLAAVMAFVDAFPQSRRDVVLIIKTTPTAQDHWGDPEGQMTQIRLLAAHDPRIRIVEQMLPFEGLLDLISAADCLVSPHRAEGYGLIPAYALALGTPVIATDYSGTQDFCTPRTADVIACDLVPAPPEQIIHKTQGAHWAQINHDALVAAMVRQITDPDAVRARRVEGMELMARHYTLDAQAARYRNRLIEIGALRHSAEARCNNVHEMFKHPHDHRVATRTDPRARYEPSSARA
jgi:glycosyltransferase involved in cell wall biosynthesis